MSDFWVIMIPENPRTVPASDKQALAQQALRELAPDSDEVKVKVSDQTRFVDCGENFQRVLCPSCGKEIDRDWWSEQMGQDYESGFQLRTITLPCCRISRTLHDLRYEWDQGFALFSLEAMNPNLSKLSADQVALFERILGCPLRVIYQHI